MTSIVGDLFRGPNATVERAETSYLYSAVHSLQTSLVFAGKYTLQLSTIASPVRHIPGQIIPFVEQVFKVQLAHAFSPLGGLVWSSDLCELTNCFNWVINNGLINDYTKKYYCSIIANVALFPTNMLTIVCYCRDFGITSFDSLGKAANAVGNARFFSWVPFVVNKVQHLPIIRAIPNLSSHAQAISNIRVLSFVAKWAAGPACMTTLCVAYIFFAADTRQKWSEKHVLLKDVIEQSDSSKTPVSGVDRDFYRNKIAKIEHKSSILKWSFYSSVSKLMLNGTILGGMLEVPVVAAVATNVPAMAALGAIVIGCIGYTAYLQSKQR